MNASSRKVWSLTTGAIAMVIAPVVVGAAFAAPKDTPKTPTTAQVATLSAQQLLQNTLARYAALTSYRSDFTGLRETTIKGKIVPQYSTRTLVYAKPNKFRATLTIGSFTSTIVSDGTKQVRYTTQPGKDAVESKVPRSVNGAGSLIVVQLLGDVKGRAELVPANTVVVDKPNATVEGVPCRVISFIAGGKLGNTELAIGLNDGLVHRICYDSAPVVAASQDAEMVIEKSQTIETYTGIQVNGPVTNADFSTAPPPGMKVVSVVPSRKEPGPPVPLGQMAPDFSVMPVGATAPVKLSAYKGQVVLLDFWATWCVPCRKSLPETQRLNATYGSKGLKVFAISDETPNKINPFIAQSKYTFPVYRDAKNEAAQAYNVQAIPTFAIIDKEGKLSAFFVGLPEDGAIEAALKKAGLGAG